MSALPSHDLSRGRRSATSRDAYVRTQPNRLLDCQRLLFALQLSPGMTSKELVVVTEIPLQTVSARLSEMKLAGQVRGTKIRRDGAEVIKALSAQTELIA